MLFRACDGREYCRCGRCPSLLPARPVSGSPFSPHMRSRVRFFCVPHGATNSALRAKTMREYLSPETGRTFLQGRRMAPRDSSVPLARHSSQGELAQSSSIPLPKLDGVEPWEGDPSRETLR